MALGRSRASLDNFLVLQVEGTLYWQRCFAFCISIDCFSCGEFQMVLLGCYLVSDFINLSRQKWCVCLPIRRLGKSCIRILMFYTSAKIMGVLFWFLFSAEGGHSFTLQGSFLKFCLYGDIFWVFHSTLDMILCNDFGDHHRDTVYRTTDSTCVTLKIQ